MFAGATQTHHHFAYPEHGARDPKSTQQEFLLPLQAIQITAYPGIFFESHMPDLIS